MPKKQNVCDLLLLNGSGEESEAYAAMIALTLSSHGISVRRGKTPSDEDCPLCLCEEDTADMAQVKEWCRKRGTVLLTYGKTGEESETHFSRPLDLHSFAERISEKLPKSEPLPPVSGRGCPLLTYDAPARAFYVGKDRLALSPRENELLLLLWNAEGRAVKREKILQRIWGENGKTGSVEVYIRFLRKKLDETYHVRLIDYERGKGYLLRREGGESV